MKKYLLIGVVCVLNNFVFGQEAGNINYLNKVRYSNENIDASTPTSPVIYISVKGMANVKADTYVAIFNVTQTGKTAEEVQELMEQRIAAVKTELDTKKGVEVYVDMLSFVPVYEWEEEKRVFNKRTYNEVPTGFELKKNLHVKYSDAKLLNEFIALLAKNEIYDLVKVDHFSSAMESVKKELMAKATLRVAEKLKNMEAVAGAGFATDQKFVADEFKVVLPVEMYQSYEAYHNSSLKLKKMGSTNRANRSPVMFYQPIVDKEFDFVINPVVLEPVIQVMYELKITVNRQLPAVKEEKNKEYLLITPTGDLKALSLKN